VFSRNRAFVLDVNPDTKVHTVYDVRDRSKPLWSFSYVVWHFPFLVSDDGQVVATVDWQHIHEKNIETAEAVTFWNKEGSFRSHALRDLCPDPPRTQDVGPGPIGQFWRTWYTDVFDLGDSFALRTTRGVEYRFRYADGELVERRWFRLRELSARLLIFGNLVAFGLIVFILWYRTAGRPTQRDDSHD
jgi:hypothetical protein